MSSSSDHEFEEQLFEAGNKLLDAPSSVEDLLPLLDVSFEFPFTFFIFLFALNLLCRVISWYSMAVHFAISRTSW